MNLLLTLPCKDSEPLCLLLGSDIVCRNWGFETHTTFRIDLKCAMVMLMETQKRWKSGKTAQTTCLPGKHQKNATKG